MGTAIYVGNSSNVVIKNLTAINCTTAIHAENTHLLQVNGLDAQGCTKGVVLDNCWDSDLKNLTIRNREHSGGVKENLLYKLVKYFMYKQ